MKMEEPRKSVTLELIDKVDEDDYDDTKPRGSIGRTSVSKGKIKLQGSIHRAGKIQFAHKVMAGDSHYTKQIMAVGTSEGTVRILDLLSHLTLKDLTDVCPEVASGMPVTGLSFLQNVRDETLLLASYSSGLTCLWDGDDGEMLWNIVQDRQTLVNRLCPAERYFAAAGTDNKISIHDLETGQVISTHEGSLNPDVMDGHTMRIFDVKFNPHNHREFVSGGWDSTVQFWDARMPHSFRKINGPHICGDGIEILKGGREVLTASWNNVNTLQMWDYAEGTLIETLVPDGYSSRLYSLEYSKRGKFFVTGGCRENMFRAVDIFTKTSFATMIDMDEAVTFVKVLPRFTGRAAHHPVAVGLGNYVRIVEVVLNL